MSPVQHFILILFALALCRFLPRHFYAPVLSVLGLVGVAIFAPGAAMFLLVTVVEAMVLTLGLGKLERSSPIRKYLPYILLLNLFFVDTHQLIFGVPMVMLAVSFSTIRIFMTCKQLLSSRKGFKTPDLVWIFAAAFFLPAIVIGPVFSGTDLKKQHQALAKSPPTPVLRDGRMVLQGLVLAVLISPLMGQFLGLLENAGQALLGRSVAAITEFFFVTWIFLFLQLFAAFWGQSLVAEHMSRFFGFKLPVNFNHPWKARSIQEFWQRWHRSMAQFVLQYIFLPLNINGIPPKLATVAAFTFMGLWHNLSLGYFVWGLTHGILLAFLPTPTGGRLRLWGFRIGLWVVVITLSWFANYGPYS